MKKKVLTIVAAILCAALLVAGSVMGTLAYLTSTAKVTNTFTVGDVKIDLDESLVNLYGKLVDDGKTRVHLNEYHLVPGTTYIKDPRVSIAPGSEASFIFVKVENGFAGTFVVVTEEEQNAGAKTIAQQMAENGWTIVEGTTDIYSFNGTAAKGYNESDPASSTGNGAVKMTTSGAVEKSANSVLINVFENFTVSQKANFGDLEDTDHNGKIDPKIEVTAYAVQGTFTSPKAAWEATFGAENGNS